MDNNTTQCMYDYGMFNGILVGQRVVIHTSDIKKENWNDYYTNLLNLFKDCIEQPAFQQTFITFVFNDGTDVELNVSDAMINICMWGFIINAGNEIMPYHVFFEERGITNSAIKNYIDEFCIIPNRYREDIPIHMLNNIIYISLRSLSFVDDFGMFFNNSINLEDFIEMANKCPEFDAILHKDYSQYPPDQMNNIAMQDTNRMIELILDSKRIMGREHCLIDAFRAKEGIKPKQFREFATNIGIKPNGEGGIFPHSIDSSYMDGGINKIEWMVAESGIGRQAQILSKKNTADSGAFARILALNNIDTILYCKPGTKTPDPSYDCHTRNFVSLYIPDENTLRQLADRYYRFDPNGIEYNTGVGTHIDKSLIGKTILLRSPITCASAAKGFGICRKCYGELFLINKLLNVGKIAAESLSAPLTQVMLSAKHLLEAKVTNPEWDSEMDKYLNIEDGTVYINQSLSVNKKWDLVIEYDDISTQTMFNINDGEDEDDSSYDEESNIEDDVEYINSFKMVSDEGEEIEFHTKDFDNLYITADFSNFIHSHKYNNDDNICVPVQVLQKEEIPLFDMGIYNDDISNKLKNVINVINLKAITESFTKDSFLQNLLEKLNSCGLNSVMSVHAEILIMNQIRDKNDVLEKPDWDYPNNNDYQVLTLRRALVCNPSIAVTMQFDNIAKTLYDPLSFKKRKPSQFDLFYHTQPQKFINSEPEKIEPISSPFKRIPYPTSDNKQ